MYTLYTVIITICTSNIKIIIIIICTVNIIYKYVQYNNSNMYSELNNMYIEYKNNNNNNIYSEYRIIILKTYHL